MDCTGFRKYVGAFADGELEVEQNLEALEHLNMCPACASRVTAVNSLKPALRRAYGDVTAPRHLHERVLSALEAEVGSRDAPAYASAVRRWRSRLMVPIGVAAALLVAAGMWQYWPRSEPRLNVVSVVPGRVVADVREQHRYCVSHRGESHNDVSLPRDFRIIAERLSARLGMGVIAPDLSAFGVELVGADSCGMMGRPGAHVLYRSVSTGRMLSVFTVNRLAGLGPESGDGAVDGALLVSSDGSPCVVAWHDGPQTYLVCADVPEATLLEIGGRVSLAGAVQPGVWGGPQPVLAVTAGK